MGPTADNGIPTPRHSPHCRQTLKSATWHKKGHQIRSAPVGTDAQDRNTPHRLPYITSRNRLTFITRITPLRPPSSSFLLTCLSSISRVPPELAHAQETLEEDSDSSSSGVVRALYEALRTRDVDTVHRIVAPDLEWWFHGPPTHQFLMRILTGSSTSEDERFEFVPDSVTSLGPIVLAEGSDQGRSIHWVHACTVTDGVITQVREYFNTSLTVTRLGVSAANLPDIVAASSSSQPHSPPVWESSLSAQAGKSVPGLVLAI